MFYADRGVKSTFVHWTEPTAVDAVDPNPDIVKLSGPDQWAELSVGEHNATYRATDSLGNSQPALSECTVFIDVQRRLNFIA